MSAMQDPGFAFIMHAVRNTGIKRAIVEHASEKRPVVSPYTVQSEDGRKFTFRLIIKKNPKKHRSRNMFDRYLVFATTLRCRSYAELLYHVPGEYRNRWDIETGYRCAKSVRPGRSARIRPYALPCFMSRLQSATPG